MCHKHRFGIVPRSSDGHSPSGHVVEERRSVNAPTANRREYGSARVSEHVTTLSYWDGIISHPIPDVPDLRRLWTPEALSLCQSEQFRIHPRFRLPHSDVAWRRRLRRGLGRARLAPRSRGSAIARSTLTALSTDRAWLKNLKAQGRRRIRFDDILARARWNQKHAKIPGGDSQAGWQGSIARFSTPHSTASSDGREWPSRGVQSGGGAGLASLGNKPSAKNWPS